MYYILLFISLHFSVPLFAQTEVELINNQSESALLSEYILFPTPDDGKEEEASIEFLVEDVDDLTATFTLSDDVTFYATAMDLLDLEMTVDRYDEDQLADNEPEAVDDIYPNGNASRFFSAGLCLRF